MAYSDQILRCKNASTSSDLAKQGYLGLDRGLIFDNYYQVTGPHYVGNKQLYIVSTLEQLAVIALEERDIEKYFHSIADDREIKLHSLGIK